MQIRNATVNTTSENKRFKLAVLSTGLGSMLAFSSLYFVQPLLPFFVDDFDISPTTASLALSVSVIGLIIGLFVFGFFSDRYGREKIIQSSLICFLLPLFLIANVESFSLIVLSRFFQGFFIAGFTVAAIPYLSEELQKQKVALAITIYISSNAVGGMGGRILVGVMADYTSWQMAVNVLGVLGVLLFIVTAILLPQAEQYSPSKLSVTKDLSGMLVHVTNPALLPIFVLGILLQLSFTGVWTYIPFYLSSDPFSMSITFISFTYLAYVFSILGPVIAGKMAVNIRQRTLMMAGIIILIAGSLLTIVPSIMFILVGLCVLCFGFFVAHSIATSYVSLTAKHHKGGASSLYLSSYYIGSAIGGTATGYVWLVFNWTGVASLSLLLLPLLFWLKKIN